MPVPALLLAIPFCTGVCTALVLAGAAPADRAAPWALAALIALAAAAASLLQDDRALACAAATCASLLAGLSLGHEAALRAYRPALLQWYERARPDGSPVHVEGILREDASLTATGVLLSVDVDSVRRLDPGRMRPAPAAEAVRGGVRLSVGGTLAAEGVREWRAGRRIAVAATLRLPAAYLNPGAGDERRALARRGISLVGAVKSAALVDVVARGSMRAEAAAAVRAWTRARLSEAVPGSGASEGVATAVLIGDRSGLPAEDERRLQEAGTYHVIAISGGNIAILALVVSSLGRVVRLPGRVSCLATAAVLLVYGAIATGAASVARAVTVAVLILGARALDHRGSAVNALAAAAVLIVALSPAAIMDPGFVLSFGATLGILLAAPWRRWRPGTRSGPASRSALRAAVRAGSGLLAATLCAEAALAPVSATLFGRVTFAGILLNFAAIPLMTAVQVGGLIAVLAGTLGDAVTSGAGQVVDAAGSALLASARLVDHAPWLSVEVSPPAVWLVTTYYTAALALLVPRLRRAAALALAGAGGVLLASPHLATAGAVPRPGAPLRIVVLDVGQGDATAVIADGHALLVDAGGIPSFASTAGESPPAFDVGERVVLPALKALGIRRLSAFVATHGDPDHLGGAAAIMRRRAVRSVWEGVPVPPHAGLRALQAMAWRRGASWRTVQPGDAERFGAVEVRVLHPPPPEWERQRVRNDDSVVLEVRVGRVSVILPGDIGAEGERSMRRHLEPGRLVVLKAAHHGSATSSTQQLLDALRPAAVIFSSGRQNRFGHPHPLVVSRYRALGAVAFSTAEDGAVFVEADGDGVELRGWTGRTATLRLPPAPR